MKQTVFCLLLLGLFLNLDAQFKHFYYDDNNGKRTLLNVNESEMVLGLDIAENQELMVYCDSDRATFRPQKTEVWKKYLAVDVEYLSGHSKALELSWFVKNKDGLFFQSLDKTLITPNQKTTIKISLQSKEQKWQGINNLDSWNPIVQAVIFCVGWKIKTADNSGKVKFSNLRYEEERTLDKLIFLDVNFPSEVKQYQRFESKFNLSNDYFNPFDDEEIKCDAVVVEPDGRVLEFPAFYTQNYQHTRFYSEEHIQAVGRPSWAIRFTPTKLGKHQIYLKASENKSVAIESKKFEFDVTANSNPKNKGFVRVDAVNNLFFAFDNGERFYPVGINLHTNIDTRSEGVFGIEPRADGGNFDYEEYFRACKKANINAVEIWLASWAFAIEWTSENKNFYGLGRYNMTNAARFDQILELAEKYDIYVHLTIDNHGKMSTQSDPEWDHNPLNLKNPFAIANGALLDTPALFFVQGEETPTLKYYRQKNRYIAARWGAYSSIFGMELWNENNLTENFGEHYNSGAVVDWIGKRAGELKALLSGKQLITTHVSGNFGQNIHFQNLWSPETIDYVVGDSYYGGKTLLVDLLRNQYKQKSIFKKPFLVTEFGGSSTGVKLLRFNADLHSGFWATFFLGNSGTAFFWWHDYALADERLMHFSAFNKFIANEDRADLAWNYQEFKVDYSKFQRIDCTSNFVSKILWQEQTTREDIYPVWHDYLMSYNSQSACDVSCLINHNKVDIYQRKVRQSRLFKYQRFPFDAISIMKSDKILGWVFERHAMYEYPDEIGKYHLSKNLKLDLNIEKIKLNPKTEIEFFSTTSGNLLLRRKLTSYELKTKRLYIPPFRGDVVFKLYIDGVSAK